MAYLEITGYGFKADALSFIGDSANTFMTLGLTINQGAADNEILAFKSSDVAHGMTAVAEDDTYADFGKFSSTAGGLLIQGFTEGTPSIGFDAYFTSDDTTKSTSASAPLTLRGFKKSGTGSTAIGANGNIAVFGNATTIRFILDGDGDSHQDVGTAWTNFDTHDDIALLNLMSAHVTRRDDPLRESFGAWLTEDRQELERIRLVTFNEDGHHFVNMSRLAMLHTGAIRQLGRSLNAVITAVRENNPALLPAGA